MRTNFTLPKKVTACLLLLVGFTTAGNILQAGTAGQDPGSLRIPPKDTQPGDSLGRRPVALTGPGQPERNLSLAGPALAAASDNILNVADLSRSPFISIQQWLKGNIAGLHVQENNGEPGTIQGLTLRGLSSPILTNRDMYGNQPAVFVNGVPLLDRHPFSGDIQLYDVNPLGSAVNLLAGLDLNNIVSVEVVKDPFTLARLGPLAAQGAILIRTKDHYNQQNHFTANASFGLALPPSGIDQTNGVYEREFRGRFFDSHGVPNAETYLPQWLADSSDPYYMSQSDWAKAYYRYAPNLSVNASLAGGDRNADYIFMAGATSDGGVADKTNFQKYNIDMALNVRPVKGLEVNLQLNGNTTQRTRNRNFRDRYAEVQLLPTLTTPVSPSRDIYRYITGQYDEGTDQNTFNIINGYLGLQYGQGEWRVSSRFKFNYNTDNRHVFYPSTLMESVNYVSDYNAYDRRFMWSTLADYGFNLGADHRFDVGVEMTILADLHHYSYVRGYDSDSDKNQSSKSGNFKKYYYRDREPGNLTSVSGLIRYRYKNVLEAGMVLRTDGYSKVQPDHRWLFTPAFNLEWNIRETLIAQSRAVSGLSLGISWSRVGRLTVTDRYSIGPQYTAMELGWQGQTALSSYNGFSSLSRPYSSGWIGYDKGWPYSEKASLDLNASLYDGRMELALSLYNNDEKDLIVRTDVPRESGYHSELSQGMQIRNRGVDLFLAGTVISRPEGLHWTLTANMNYNRNELIKLPGGRSEIELNGRKLVVGQSVDRFWILENQGIYTSEEQIPVLDGKKLTVGGTALQAGDPVWRDVNGDNTIDDRDRVLKGHSTPKFTGGLTSRFTYGKFDWGFHLFFAAGHHALNARSAQRYDFMNLDTRNSLEAVREVFFWQNTWDKNDYTLYHPLSQVDPYRTEQDMFLEKLAYLKLRSVTVGYTFTLTGKKKAREDNAYVYLSGTNLLTFTGFSGDDPELVDFTGYYRGYSHPLAPMINAGLKLKF